MKRLSLCLVLGAAWFSCNREEIKSSTLFTRISSEQSQLTFRNDLVYDKKFNIYTYRNFYNGGGVALGDINNDGLIDIFFTANQGADRLYLNKGNFVFEDITERAGVKGRRAWSTGVSMADVNGDGFLDIYVCNSGNVDGDDKENELFINNGDLTFTERGQEMGAADNGYTTHAVFFDYDQDGDLDLYILNNSYQSIGSFNLQKNERGKRDAKGGHKLLRNDNGHFVDVSVQAGIFGSVIAFGLGVTVGDINKDGWLDMYVSNDFFERDYLYINNRNGTFTETLPTYMKSISGASMGADLADINNDGFSDLFVTEMLPHSNERLKTVTTFENWDRYQYSVANGYYHQFTRNMLQVNNQDGTFSEIGRLAGVEATDWSWGALMFDADNDGKKDIFVANGIYQDLTNQDYLQYASSEEFVKSVVTRKQVDFKHLIDIIPSNPVPKYIFQNMGNYQFDDKSVAWGLGIEGFSNGSAYGDLDNDGDLDLVVNNVNSEAYLFRNEAQRVYPKNHFLKFILKGEGKNVAAIGTQITLHAGEETFYLEQMPMRGFESTVDPRPNFGVGSHNQVDRVEVRWPDGKVTKLDSVKTNQVLTLNQKDGVVSLVKATSVLAEKTFTPLPAQHFGIDFKHIENEFVDFDRDRLIYHMVSNEGPRVAVADVNGDGLDDFYIGGAKDGLRSLYIQTRAGKFLLSNEKLLSQDHGSEDLGSVFFDADGDGDKDLYVCSGGPEFSSSSTVLSDRLYFNDGKGNYSRSKQLLPTAKLESKSCVRASDFDHDGDIDLFVGVRLEPFRYGIPVNGYLLENDGKGFFKDVTEQRAKALKGFGMITDAIWADVDGDHDEDLIVAGEWTPLTVFVNEQGIFTDRTNQNGLLFSNGWWNSIAVADVDHDGDLDIIGANHGLNSRFRASQQKPISLYVGDFDKNGSIEQILCMYNGDKSFPMALRHDLIQQLPYLKKKYLKYDSYKDQTITDIFTPEQLKESVKSEAYNLASSIAFNDGKGNFTVKSLPVDAQLSPMYGLLVRDLDADGNLDILMGGNQYRTKPEVGRYDASFGVYLKGDGKGNFSVVKPKDSGFFVDGEVRDIHALRVGKDDCVLVTRNNDTPVLFKIRK